MDTTPKYDLPGAFTPPDRDELMAKLLAKKGAGAGQDKRKGVGDYVDIEGRPFQIKKILAGGRIMVKEMGQWPAGVPDWQANDLANRRWRQDLAAALVEYLEEEASETSREFSNEAIRESLIPALLGDAPR
jgi:hypothetical protein